MTDIVQVAVIGAATTIVTLFVNRWFKKMDEKLDKIHTEINGKMTKLFHFLLARLYHGLQELGLIIV